MKRNRRGFTISVKMPKRSGHTPHRSGEWAGRKQSYRFRRDSPPLRYYIAAEKVIWDYVNKNPEKFIGGQSDD